MARRCKDLETLADVYSKCTTLVSGERMGNTYRFDSGSGHVAYDGRTIEYDGETCKITAQPDVQQGIDCFRVAYYIYPSTVLEAIAGRKKGQKIKDVLRNLAPEITLRKEILRAGFEPSEEDGAQSRFHTYDARQLYQLIEYHIKKDPLYKGDRKTFIRERKQQAKHERGKRSTASGSQHNHSNNGNQSQQPTADPTASDPESPSIAV